MSLQHKNMPIPPFRAASEESDCWHKPRLINKNLPARRIAFRIEDCKNFKSRSCNRFCISMPAKENAAFAKKRE